jgi:hypothetical protein
MTDWLTNFMFQETIEQRKQPGINQKAILSLKIASYS